MGVSSLGGRRAAERGYLSKAMLPISLFQTVRELAHDFNILAIGAHYEG